MTFQSVYWLNNPIYRQKKIIPHGQNKNKSNRPMIRPQENFYIYNTGINDH